MSGTLRDKVRTLLIGRAVAAGSVEPLPPLRNRAEARKFLRGRGPFMGSRITPKEGDPKAATRRVTTRQKRAEQREQARGHADE